MDPAEQHSVSKELESLGIFQVKLCASQPAMLQEDSLRPSDANGVHCLEVTRLDVFENFVSSLQEGVLQTMLKNEDFRRNVISLRQHQNRFEDVCKLIRSGDFLKNGTDLIKIWDSAHYALWEKEHKKPLTSLRRFRIRESNYSYLKLLKYLCKKIMIKLVQSRNPYPPSIAKYRHRKLDANVRVFLMHWYNNNSYPSQKERAEISQTTGLSDTQIKTWFANARRRERKKECPLYLARQAAKEKGKK